MLVSESILEPFGLRLIDDLRNSQRGKGLIASGKSAASLRQEVTRQDRVVTLRLYGLSYWRFQEVPGRGPNRKGGRPSTAFVEIIRQWIQVKNLSIPLSAAGAIAYNIVNFGVKVANRYNEGGVLTEPLNSKRVQSLLLPTLKAEYFDSIKSEIFKP